MSHTHTMASLLPIVRELFKDTLEADDIKDDDDFFWLGGDSFSAILVGDRLARLGFDVPRTFVFDHPNIQSICEALLSAHLSSSPKPL